MVASGTHDGSPLLVITADDFGYRAAYDGGIVLAARAGAIDRVSVMATRKCDPTPLLELGVPLGLHLEPAEAIAVQFRLFTQLVGRPPQFIDGHRHCHAE